MSLGLSSFFIKASVAALKAYPRLNAEIQGDEISVAIDGKDIGSFHSAGIANPTKRMLRFSVPRNTVVDDVKIYRKG